MNFKVFLLITSLMVTSVAAGYPQGAQSEILLKMFWGTSTDQAGIIDEAEMERCGPISFAVADESILLLDTVKTRVLSKAKGAPVKTLGKNLSGWAICSDGDEGFFLLNDSHIQHIAKDGTVKVEFSTEAQRIIHGYGTDLTISDNSTLNLLNVDQKTYTVARKNSDNVFTASTAAETLSGRSGSGASGMRFQIKRLSNRDVRLLGSDPGGKIMLSCPISVDEGSLGAVLFKGQDKDGNLYIELERIADAQVHLEVREYGPSGECLQIYPLPNDYYTTVYKKTEVDADGSVFHFQTTESGVIVTRNWRKR